MTGALDVAVIGAGVVGLACAAELAGRGRQVIVLERSGAPARETSARNSEVIHAGLYYEPGSLKAETCVEGRERVYARCAQRGIGHRRIGKLIVACDPGEIAELERIAARASACGAGELEWLDAAQVRAREPRVRAVAGLWSARTGIVDAHGLASSFEAELEAAGGALALHTEVLGLEGLGDRWRVETRSGDGERFDLEVPHVVNAAGLAADRVAEMAGIDVDALGWRIRWCRGDYFSVAPALGALTRHLVYPVPSGGGLGVHVTVDLGGRFRLGPDARWVDEISYAVDPARAAAFARAARRYLPEIRAEHLAPDFAGIRPRLTGPGEPLRDFVCAESSALGAPGLVNLLGIESPGLTAAPALARRVADLLG